VADNDLERELNRQYEADKRAETMIYGYCDDCEKPIKCGDTFIEIGGIKLCNDCIEERKQKAGE